MIKVFIADDHALIREGIKKLISTESDIKFVGETSDPYQIVSSIQKSKPDVLVLDISMPGKSGIDVLKDIKAVSPETKVLIMTMMPENQYAKRALKAGASGYLIKNSAPDELLPAIRRITSSRRFVSESLAEKLAEDLDGTTKKDAHEVLSDREFQKLKMIASRKTQTEIADELSISISTANTYRSRILEKLDLHTNAELIHYTYQNKLVE